MILQEIFGRLKGKTVWIAGGRRVGQTVAQALGEAGMNIVVSYRGSRAEAEGVVQEILRRGGRAMAVQVDVSRRAEVEQAVAAVEKEMGAVHYCVQMASVFGERRWDEIHEKDWEENIAAHISGSFWLTQTLARRWQETNWRGKIVLFTDRTTVESGHPYLRHLPYIVTKGAVQTMVKVLARELAPAGIAVNAIAPGPLVRPPTISEKEWQAIRDSAPLRGITDETSVRQVALAVAYLLSVELTTGSTLLLDSGFNIS